MFYQALKRVFGDVKYAGLALVTSVAVLVFAAWLPNLGLVWQIGTSSSVSLADKIKVLASLAGSITTNFTLFSALSLVTVALLFGVNVALIAYSVALRRRFGGAGAATSIGGLAAGLTGAGCAACGAFLLTPILSLASATGFLAILPFGGEEFSAAGIVLLALSLFWTCRRLAATHVCQAKENAQPVPSRKPLIRG